MATGTNKPVGSADPRDLLTNAENLDRAVNSSSRTWVDRRGVERATMHAVETAVPDAVAARVAAEAARDNALLARDAAIAAAGTIYATEAEGRAAVADGEMFRVAGSGTVAARLFQRTSATASLLITEFPSYAALADLEARFAQPFAYLKQELSNPLKSVRIRLVGDSITWGSGASNRSPNEPRNGTLSDPRNTIDPISPTWANLLRNWLAHVYGSGTVIQNAPGSGYSLATNDALLLTSNIGLTTFKDRSGSLYTGNIVIQSGIGSETGVYIDIGGYHASPSFYPAFVEFDTNAEEIEIIYAQLAVGSESESRVHVYANGIKIDDFTSFASVAEFNKTRKIMLDGGLKTIRLQSESSVANFRFQGVRATRKIQVANDGINGSTTASWLATVPLNNSIQASDTHVLVQLGTNDRIKSTSTGSTGKLAMRLEQIVDATLAKSPGANIVLISANAVTQDENPETSVYAFGMREVDEVVRRVAKKKSCGFLSQFAHTLQLKLDGVEYLADGLHPNDVGYRAMFENIRNRLQ